MINFKIFKNIFLKADFFVEFSCSVFVNNRIREFDKIINQQKIKKMTTFILIVSIIVFLYGAIALFSAGKIEGENGTIKLRFGIPAILLGGVSTIVFSLLTIIGPQDVGVIVTPKGVSEKSVYTGWHVVAPWNTLKRMDKTVWVYTFSGDDAIWVPTKDGIKIGLDVSVSWRIDPVYAWWIYANVSEDEGGDDGRYKWLEQNVIRPKTKSAVALAVSRFTPIEAYSNKREDIKNLSFDVLATELRTYHLILDQVDMREVFYNPEYEKAINAKKLAEQEVLRLVEVTRQKEEQLKQAEIDKNISIQKAEGEAKALQIKGSSIAANPKIISLEWIDKWDGKLPQYMLGNGEGVILNLPKQ